MLTHLPFELQSHHILHHLNPLELFSWRLSCKESYISTKSEQFHCSYWSNRDHHEYCEYLKLISEQSTSRTFLVVVRYAECLGNVSDFAILEKCYYNFITRESPYLDIIRDLIMERNPAYLPFPVPFLGDYIKAKELILPLFRDYMEKGEAYDNFILLENAYKGIKLLFTHTNVSDSNVITNLLIKMFYKDINIMGMQEHAVKKCASVEDGDVSLFFGDFLTNMIEINHPAIYNFNPCSPYHNMFRNRLIKFRSLNEICSCGYTVGEIEHIIETKNIECTNKTLIISIFSKKKSEYISVLGFWHIDPNEFVKISKKRIKKDKLADYYDKAIKISFIHGYNWWAFMLEKCIEQAC